MSLLLRRFWVIGVRVTLPHDLMEDAPNGVEVSLFRIPNRDHSQPPTGAYRPVVAEPRERDPRSDCDCAYGKSSGSVFVVPPSGGCGGERGNRMKAELRTRLPYTHS